MDVALGSKLMKECDAKAINELGVPSFVLMERAAMFVAEQIQKRFSINNRIAVLCGSGNNGGDGLALARILTDYGYNADIYLCLPSSEYSKECAEQLKIVKKYDLRIVALKDDSDMGNFAYDLKTKYDLVVDAIFGVGLNRKLPSNVIEIIRLVNRYKGSYQVMSVDVPSGLDSDTAEVHGAAVIADFTLVLAYIKTGLILSDAGNYVGKLILGEIGINRRSMSFEPKVFCNFSGYHSFLPVRKKASHKGNFGKLLILAGNEQMSGACYLAAKSAYRMGVGLVYVLTHSDNLGILKTLLPECIVSAYNKGKEADYDTMNSLIEICDAALIGCGMGKSLLSQRVMEHMLFHFDKPKVIDADGINYLSKLEKNKWKDRKELCVLTPHLGEFSGLMKIDICEIKKNMLFYSGMFTRETKCILVLKSASTIVDNSDLSFINTLGNSGMATAGSGDVLAGMIAAGLTQYLLRQGNEEKIEEKGVWELISSLVELHSVAGDLAAAELSEYSVMAEDLIRFIPRAINRQRGNDEKRDD